MWLCVHDPADAEKVASAFSNWPSTHWEFDFTRHGSPLLERDVIFVSGGRNEGRFPLFRGLESADLVMFYFEGNNPEEIGPGQHHVSLEDLPQHLRNASANRSVVAIELTSQNPANSNAVQRFGRIEDHAALGIPFMLVSPIDSIRLRTSAGIAGGHGDDRLIYAQQQLIRTNQPTTETTLRGQAMGVCPFDEERHPPQGISQWTEQFLMVQGDSYQLPVAHLTLPRMWSCIHDSYRYSGSQLSELYDFMRQVMDETESNGVSAGRASSAWRPHINRTASRARTGGQGGGLLAAQFTAYGQLHGFPAGSIQEVDDRFSHHSAQHHYRTRANLCTPANPIQPLQRGGECIIQLYSDTLGALNLFCQGFSVSSTIASALIPHLEERHFLITRRLRQVGHLSKDTYTGGMAVTDWLFTRRRAEHWNLSTHPRAVSTNPQDRLHLYAVEGAFTSSQVIAQVADVYGRRTRNRIDLYRCSDGVFLGQPLADLLGVPFLTTLAD